MAAAGDIYLCSSRYEVLLSREGRKPIQFQPEKIERSDRVASGKLKTDIIATKNIITIPYELISQTDLETFNTLYALNSELSLIVYNTDTEHEDYTVIMEPPPRTRGYVLPETLWSDVSIVLKEV